MKPRAESGFSTLELIAAVAIIAVALAPLAALQTQLARGQARLAAQHEELTAVNNGLALLRGVNPMLTPEGRRQIDDATVLTWTSAPASPLEPSVNPPGFEVRLYRVSAIVRESDGAAATFQVDLLGWRAGSDEMSRVRE